MSVTGKKIKSVYPDAVFAENTDSGKLYINGDTSIITDSDDNIIEVIEFSLDAEPIEDNFLED